MSRELIVTVFVFAGSVLAACFLSFLWRKVLLPIARRTRTNLDRVILKSLEKPVPFLVLVIGFNIGFQRMRLLPTLMEAEHLVRIIDGVFYTAIVLAITFIAYALVRSFAGWYLADVASRTKTTLDNEFVPLFSRLAKVIIFFVTTVVLLSHFEVNVSGFLITGGVAALAIALAGQETLANMISGFVIMIDRPFRPGDRIELSDGMVGDVHEVGLRSTKILTFDNTLIIVPNSEIAKTRIINYSYPDEKFKIRQMVSVAYGSDMEKMKGILLDICHKHAEVMDDPQPVAHFLEFGESSLDVRLTCWVRNYMDKFRITDEINMEIKRHFEEEGIEIPFPQTDVHLK